MNPDLQTAIEAAISKSLGHSFHTHDTRSASCGCIHQGFLLYAENAAYFAKVNAVHKLDLFKTEAVGLEALINLDPSLALELSFARPTVNTAFWQWRQLALGSTQSGDWKRIGQQLNAIHQRTNELFGWPDDNYICASPQQNTWHGDWAEFFFQIRLRPQLRMARANGYKFHSEDTLYEAAKHLLADHKLKV